MRTIRVDCPYCSMDHAVSHNPGWQTHHCFNCGNSFVVYIDDYGRVDVRREEDFVAASCFEMFSDQFIKLLQGEDWELLDSYRDEIDLIARKDMGFYQSINFIGVTNGNSYNDVSGVRQTLDKFYDFIERNSDMSDMSHSFSGLLLLTFDNVYKTEIDDESRMLEHNSFWKRIYTSAGAFDFSTETYFGSKSRYGKVWDILLPPLFNRIDLSKCKG